MTNDMEKQQMKLETLTFRKGDKVGTVVTDGTRTRTYTEEDTVLFGKLTHAIAHMEVQGYRLTNN